MEAARLTGPSTQGKLTTAMPSTLGQRIRELRDSRDLSLREFSRALDGISAAHLSDIELGRRYPSDDLLAKMARVLGTSIDDLRTYDARPPMDDLRRRSEEDPTFGFALRKLVDKEIDSKDLLNWAEKRPDRKKK